MVTRTVQLSAVVEVTMFICTRLLLTKVAVAAVPSALLGALPMGAWPRAQLFWTAKMPSLMVVGPV